MSDPDVPPVKRKPGRPPGARNKPKQEIIPPAPKVAPDGPRPPSRSEVVANSEGWQQFKTGHNPRAIRRNVLALLHGSSEVVVKEFVRVASNLPDADGRMPDPRAHIIAANIHLDRTLGKAGDLPQGLDENAGRVSMANVGMLTPEERAELFLHLQEVGRLTGLADKRAAEAAEATEND